MSDSIKYRNVMIMFISLKAKPHHAVLSILPVFTGLALAIKTTASTLRSHGRKTSFFSRRIKLYRHFFESSSLTISRCGLSSLQPVRYVISCVLVVLMTTDDRYQINSDLQTKAPTATLKSSQWRHCDDFKMVLYGLRRELPFPLANDSTSGNLRTRLEWTVTEN